MILTLSPSRATSYINVASSDLMCYINAHFICTFIVFIAFSLHYSSLFFRFCIYFQILYIYLYCLYFNTLHQLNQVKFPVSANLLDNKLDSEEKMHFFLSNKAIKVGTDEPEDCPSYVAIGPHCQDTLMLYFSCGLYFFLSLPVAFQIYLWLACCMFFSVLIDPTNLYIVLIDYCLFLQLSCCFFPPLSLSCHPYCSVWSVIIGHLLCPIHSNSQ